MVDLQSWDRVDQMPVFLNSGIILKTCPRCFWGGILWVLWQLTLLHIPLASLLSPCGTTPLILSTAVPLVGLLCPTILKTNFTH